MTGDATATPLRGRPARNLRREAERALRRGGGLYTLPDVMDGIARGEMQSFVVGAEGWMVTQVCTFPRRKIVFVLLYVGDLSGVAEANRLVLEFAQEQGASAVIAEGRPGFDRVYADHGWVKVSHTYMTGVAVNGRIEEHATGGDDANPESGIAGVG